MKRTTVFLPLPLQASLRVLAERTGVSVAELIRRAADEYLAKHAAMK